MNTARWATYRTPSLMLRLLGVGQGSTTGRRKFRLFSVACWRRVADMLSDGRLEALIEAQEAFSEGTIDEPTLEAAVAEATPVKGVRGLYRATLGDRDHSSWVTRFGITFDPESMSWATVELAARRARLGLGMAATDREGWESVRRAARVEARAQADLLREIFGNPFHPPIVDLAWLAWDGGAIPSLARAIYDDRAFDRMPILGDALEEAGCPDPAVLGHCRRDSGHVRGCWVLDALLGRG